MITIITVGKIKEKYLIEGINEYLKRISKYTKIKIIELEDESFDINKTLKAESDKMIKHINKKSYIIALDINGNQMNSIDFSNLINNKINLYSEITFIIGGSYGIDESIKKISNENLSFSKMTFPHQLFRLIFLEQLYRSFKIINNETYHK